MLGTWVLSMVLVNTVFIAWLGLALGRVAGGHHGLLYPHRVDVLPKPVELLGSHQGGALDGLCQTHAAISKNEFATPSTKLVGHHKGYLTDGHWR